MKKLIERILNKQSGNIVITYDGYKKSSYMDRTVSDENGNIENILSKKEDLYLINKEISEEEMMGEIVKISFDLRKNNKKIFIVFDPFLGSNIKKDRINILQKFKFFYERLSHEIDNLEKNKNFIFKILGKTNFDLEVLLKNSLNDFYTSVYFKGDKFNLKNSLTIRETIGLDFDAYSNMPKDFVFSKEEKEFVAKNF